MIRGSRSSCVCYIRLVSTKQKTKHLQHWDLNYDSLIPDWLYISTSLTLTEVLCCSHQNQVLPPPPQCWFLVGKMGKEGRETNTTSDFSSKFTKSGLYRIFSQSLNDIFIRGDEVICIEWASWQNHREFNNTKQKQVSRSFLLHC